MWNVHKMQTKTEMEEREKKIYMKNIRIKTKQHIKITFQFVCLLFFFFVWTITKGMKKIEEWNIYYNVEIEWWTNPYEWYNWTGGMGTRIGWFHWFVLTIKSIFDFSNDFNCLIFAIRIGMQANILMFSNNSTLFFCFSHANFYWLSNQVRVVAQSVTRFCVKSHLSSLDDFSY